MKLLVQFVAGRVMICDEGGIPLPRQRAISIDRPVDRSHVGTDGWVKVRPIAPATLTVEFEIDGSDVQLVAPT